MAAITFMEIMNCYPDNPMVYDHIKRDCGKLIPFVGAGLSVPCYPLWPSALKELAEQVAVPETKSDILDMVEGENPQLLEAAQALEDYWGPRGMADHLLELFSAAKIQEHKEKLPHQSVWLLPLLFPGKPAVTTNFDRVLETVYHMQGCQFDTKILPNRQELQDQLRQGERHGLLKLHGDIGSETLEYSSIIFGKRQYEEAYQPGTPIVTNLQAWFSGKMMLFLGCSLKADEYLNLLQGVVQLHPGVTHYAILECEDVRDAAARARQLRDQWGIQALFYPKGRHEAVRVILEKLLEDHNPTAYQTLATHVGALSNQSPSSRFHYKSGAVSFHGRQEELEQLREFCGQEHVAFRWWAVTGAGGAGKSRLVYEFGREMEGSGWNVLWLNSTHMDNLEALPIPTKTLVVVDYAQAYLGPLGHWMEQLAQRPRLVPVRLLLLERDGESVDSSSWGSGLRAEVGRVTLVRRSCWKEPFLQITPLQEEELLRIMTDFAATVGKSLPEAKAQQLLETLKTTDPELRRPLYAMFLTDAWANGKEPEQWGQKAVLDYVLQRENEYFEEKTKETIGNIPRLKKNLNKLRLVATIWDGITLEQVAQEYPKLWEAFQQQAEKMDCVESEEDLLCQVGILQGAELAGLKPDLLGEYFVLQHITGPEVLQLLFPDGWQSKGRIVVFLFRMYLDYYDILEDMGIFWSHMLCSAIKPVDEYGKMWVNVTGLSNKYAARAVDILSMLWEKNGKRENDASSYAQGLVNLSAKQTVKKGVEAIQKIEGLSMMYPRSAKIAAREAMALANLCYKQKEQEGIRTIKRLEALSGMYPGDEEIAVWYAQGLFNFSNKQEREKAAKTIRRLEAVNRAHPRNEKIAALCVGGMVNMSIKQTLEKSKEAVEHLKLLSQEHPDNEEFIQEYAKGLFILSSRQELEDAIETIGRLKMLNRVYVGNEEIALRYAQGLVNLSVKQQVEEGTKTIEHLEVLSRMYKNEEIAGVCAQGLVNILYRQNTADSIRTIKQLRALSEKYPWNEKISLWYARGVLNLSIRQTREGAEEAVKCLEKVNRANPRNEEIALLYAKGLFNVSTQQLGNEAVETIGSLEKVSRANPRNEEITLLYAKGLVNLLCGQRLGKSSEIIERLEKMSSACPWNEKIAVVYATGLVNQLGQQTTEKGAETVGRLEELHSIHSENEQIAVAYAMGLANFSKKQSVVEAKKTIERIKRLESMHLDNEKIASSFAVGLFNLTTKQSDREVQNTIFALHDLCRKHPENQDVKWILEKALEKLQKK